MVGGRVVAIRVVGHAERVAAVGFSGLVVFIKENTLELLAYVEQLVLMVIK